MEAFRNRFGLEDVWENSADGIRVTDSAGIIVGVNPAFCKLFDKPEEELVNQPFHILYHANIQGEIYKEYQDDFFNHEIKPILKGEPYSGTDGRFGSNIQIHP